MTPPGNAWNELSLSEDPAVALLQKLGFRYVAPEILEAERESVKVPLLPSRLAKALKKLNPWLSDDNLHKAVRSVGAVQSATLIEASEEVYETLVHTRSFEQDLGDGRKSHDVRFFDFDNPTNNELLVTRQYAVKGAKKTIYPDIVVFINGIPLAVIECKSPKLGEAWKLEAIDQFSRYQELDDKYRELGAPRLFETVQVLIATCRQAAVYGTVTTPYRFFAEWKTTWPMTPEKLRALVGREPTAQDVTLAGLLAPQNLLDLVRNFVAFDPDRDTGRVVRKLCRYQQFTAVNKAIERARTAKKPDDRGGVVWHTQGSGKSLTMLWLALKLRRDPLHENPTLVLVTDRKDLDAQITGTFQACKFPNPERAESVRHLRELLSGPPGKTVLTTVQKFQELAATGGSSGKRAARKEHPVLSEAHNLFVLTDEAHRTQYGGLAANMRKALPNAAFFGFTGTPIDKKDRSTLSTFGPYIDTYTIEQAVADGATVPIFYEGRLPALRIIGNTLDALFDRVFADRSDEEREAIKKRYANEQTLAGAPKRVETICLDLLDHYAKAIQPGGFKAQVVACTRENAVLYKETLDRLHGPQSAIIISGSNKDATHLVKHHTSEEQRTALIDRFLAKDDPLKILVVCDMLLTGFDAPIEQVMYLDSPLKEHTLLQAIARVNRTADGKSYGLVIDYWGVSEALTEALEIFAPSEVKGAMTPKSDELPRLQARHAAAVRFFVRVKDKDDLDACVAVLEPEDVRAEFDAAFKRFSQSLDMLLPDPSALPYVADARWLGKIRQAAAAKFRDKKIDIADCGAKVRKLIEEAVAADGIEILVKPISLFAPELEEKLKKLKTPEARASEMEHAIRDEIHVRLDDDPVFFTSLRERLEQIIEDRKAKRIDAARELQRLEDEIRKKIRARAETAATLGLSETGLAIYGLISERKPLTAAEKTGNAYGKVDESKKELASLLEEQLEPQVSLVDWVHKDDVQREMRKRIKRQLRAAGFADDKLDATADSIVDLMKRRRGR
ncbi:type I restriction endonuclease subunit R [Sorangium atrum]|uniref:Type I restriction enzyme endonuclease subunit n=1 Tax=Sorangium atrum TaxID=2995308 RepID=A0ABT5BXZ1_9BACT|nr:type I restriction endonuclease subunit R [Sorangium aterium]MDC0678986.1 type I restriction endonuclease subunit R [Sorangium aterium]